MPSIRDSSKIMYIHTVECSESIKIACWHKKKINMARYSQQIVEWKNPKFSMEQGILFVSTDVKLDTCVCASTENWMEAIYFFNSYCVRCAH